MIIEVCSREEAVNYAKDDSWAAISISTYLDEFPELQVKNRKGLLQINFADVTKEQDTLRLDALCGKSGSEFFNLQHANQIIEFVDSVLPLDYLLIHCEQGYSRSPAVAAAVALYLGMDHNHFFDNYDPNKHVFELLKTKMEIK